MRHRLTSRAFLALVVSAMCITGFGCGGDSTDEAEASERGGCGDAISWISWEEVRSHVGEVATVRGPVVSTFFAAESSGQPTFLNIGRDHPDPDRFTVLIWGEDRDRFRRPPEERYRNRTVCVSGLVELYEGVPEVIVDAPGQISAVQGR